MFPSNIPYLLLMIIPIIIGFNKSAVKKVNYSILTFFALLFLVLSCRSIEIGVDVSSYKNKFDILLNTGWENVGSVVREVGYGYVNKLIQVFSSDFQVFLAVVALICVLPVAYLYREDKNNNYLKVILFLNMATFQFMFSGLRQTMTISLGVFAFLFVRKKRIWLFLITVIIAFYIHHTSFILLFLYPIYHTKIKKKHLLVIVPLLFLIFIFKQQIVALALSLMADSSEMSIYNERYSNFTDTGAYGSLFQFAVFSILSYFFIDEKNASRSILGLRNILLLATCLQMVALINPVLMRINYYFIIFVPFILSVMFTNCQLKYKKMARVISVLFCLFFTAYYLQKVYNGVDILEIYPYKPFWFDTF